MKTITDATASTNPLLALLGKVAPDFDVTSAEKLANTKEAAKHAFEVSGAALKQVFVNNESYQVGTDRFENWSAKDSPVDRSVVPRLTNITLVAGTMAAGVLGVVLGAVRGAGVKLSHGAGAS